NAVLHTLYRARVPRASGDKPGNVWILEEELAVFPAPAGINRGITATQRLLSSVPRASGDKPLTNVFKNAYNKVFPAPAGIKPGAAMVVRVMAACSPRQRG
ncbi:hypothetical protein SEES004_22393, partial [Salmonella enterica subsp. enterica serovar Senftenberg str. 361154004]